MGSPVRIEIDPNLDSSVYIFDIVFECKARYVDLLSEEDLKDFGSFHTGMKELDTHNMTQLVSANLNIAQMAEHLSKNYTLRFVYPQDVLKMYEYTEHHLNRWMIKLNEMSLNGEGAPLDDLIKLDNFCSLVYEQAKFYDEPKLDSLQQKYGSTRSFDYVMNILNTTSNNKDSKIKETAAKHRRGYSEMLLDMKMRKASVNFNVNQVRLNG